MANSDTTSAGAGASTTAGSTGGAGGATGSTASGGAAGGTSEAKSRFSAAIDEAKAGAEALKSEALERGAAYRDKVGQSTGDLASEARAYADQARDKAATLATEGKARASDALAGLSRTIADTAQTIDEKLGPQYGEYARSAARSMQETAARLEAKDMGELADDAREFIRKSPAAAVGIAAVAGFVLARMFRGSNEA